MTEIVSVLKHSTVLSNDIDGISNDIDGIDGICSHVVKITISEIVFVLNT